MDLDISKLDLTDPEVQKLLKVIADDQDYNSALKEFLDSAYDWQKQAVAFTNNHRVTGLICGNQMGKSTTACAILACHLTGEYPIWWEGKKYDRPVRIMAAGVDSNHNKNVLQEKLFGTNNRRDKKSLGSGMIPKKVIVESLIVSVRGDDIQSAKIKHKSGGQSEIIFRAYSQGREAAQGFPADIIMIDEQPNDEFWKEALTRTKATQGHVLCAFTPLLGRTHLVEELMVLPEKEGAPEDKYGVKYRTDSKWSMVRASWFDAPHIINNDPTAVEDAKRDYTSDYEARVFGLPVVGAGRIYDHHPDAITFNPDHFNVSKDWVSLIGVDFGWTKNDPSAMIRVSWDKTNDVIYITDEFKGHTPTDREFARNVHYIDPSVPVAWPRDGNTSADWKGGGSISDKLRSEYSVNLLRDPFINPVGLDGNKNNHLHPGFQEINDRFRTNRLKISTGCKELITEIENYGYGKDSNGISTGKPNKNSEDHLCDAMRYAVMTIIQGYGKQPYRADFFGSYSKRDKDRDEEYANSII